MSVRDLLSETAVEIDQSIEMTMTVTKRRRQKAAEESVSQNLEREREDEKRDIAQLARPSVHPSRSVIDVASSHSDEERSAEAHLLIRRVPS